MYWSSQYVVIAISALQTSKIVFISISLASYPNSTPCSTDRFQYRHAEERSGVSDTESDQCCGMESGWQARVAQYCHESSKRYRVGLLYKINYNSYTHTVILAQLTKFCLWLNTGRQPLYTYTPHTTVRTQKDTVQSIECLNNYNAPKTTET